MYLFARDASQSDKTMNFVLVNQRLSFSLKIIGILNKIQFFLSIPKSGTNFKITSLRKI